MRGLLVGFAAALAFAASAGATDDGLTFFPASQGAMTEAAWRGQQGEQDDQGEARQGLLLQNLAAQPGGAAAGHVLGLEERPVQFLASLAFEYRTDGVCGPTDPRWALFVRGQKRTYEVNLGCKFGVTTPGAEPGWLRKTFTNRFIRTEILRKGGTDALFGRITALALVFDRVRGFVFVDNIAVRSKGGSNVWTYAGDNGGTTPPGGLEFSSDQLALLAQPLTSDEQLSEEELMATLTPDEQALIDQEIG
jgi:hypothetical protein